MIRTLILSFACSLACILQAQTGVEWSAPQTVAPSSFGFTRPRVVINGDGNPVVLWGRETGMKANFVAVANGAGFDPSVQVTYMSTPPSIDYWMGGDIAAVGNELWTSYKATPENTMPMYARRSLDGGYTWGDTIRIGTDPWARFPSITIGNAGEPVVQYMAFDAGFVNARHVTARMSGGTFQPAEDVSTPFAPGDVCDCCPGQVTAAGDAVVTMYRNAGSNIRVIYGAASNDGGATYATGGLLDPTNWNLMACPATGPDGYIAGDSVRYVWMSGAVNGSKVNLSSAALSDFALGPMVKVHPGQPANIEQNYPRIAGNGDTLGVVWEQTAGSDRNVLFSWSATGVYGMSAPDTLNLGTSGSQRTPDIAYANGTFHIVWSDEATGLVNYRTATLTSTTGITDGAEFIRMSAWPSPATTTLRVDLPAGVTATLRLFDMAGHCVLNAPHGSTQLDVTGISVGHYVLQASDAGGKVLAQLPVQVAR